MRFPLIAILLISAGCGPSILPLANYAQTESFKENKDTNQEMTKRSSMDFPPQGYTTWTLGSNASVTGDAATSQKLADALIQATAIRAKADVEVELQKKEQLKIQAEASTQQQLNALGYAVAAAILMALAWILVTWLKSSAAGRAALAAANAAGETVFSGAKNAIHRIDDAIAKTDDTDAAYNLMVEKNRILHDALDQVKAKSAKPS